MVMHSGHYIVMHRTTDMCVDSLKWWTNFKRTEKKSEVIYVFKRRGVDDVFAFSRNVVKECATSTPLLKEKMKMRGSFGVWLLLVEAQYTWWGSITPRQGVISSFFIKGFGPIFPHTRLTPSKVYWYYEEWLLRWHPMGPTPHTHTHTYL